MPFSSSARPVSRQAGSPYDGDRGGRLAEYLLENRHLLDGRCARQDQGDEVAGPHLGVPGHVPGRGPAERGGELVVEVGDASDGCPQ